MKKVFTIFLFAGSTIFNLYSQVCTGCTQTISTTISTPINAGTGDVICITSSGVVNANVIESGGVICNEGTISGNITTSGSGGFKNYGTINATTVTANGGGGAYFRNYGIITANTINVGGYCHFFNHNIVNCLGNFTCSNVAAFDNFGGMFVGGNFDNSSYFYTNCIIKVNGTFTNSDAIDGPDFTCGGFSVLGGATNNGGFGSNLDMCDSTNIGGWTAQNGSVDATVTYCVCNNFCSTAIGIEENSSTKTNVSIFPNPAKEFVTFNINQDIQEPFDIYLYDALGQLQRVVYSQFTNKVIIPRNGLPAGMYIYQIRLEDKKTLCGKFMFN